MKVAVTGANGFLGSWLVRRLLDDGHQVRAVVRKSSDLSELAELKPEYIFGDIGDSTSLLEAFKDQEIVFHLAGAIAYKKSERALMETVNVQGTQNVVDACVNLQTPQLLHLSSVVAVGASFKQSVLDENSPYLIQKLDLGYFETKRKAEQIVIGAVKENRIRAVCVNPSTIYGAGDAKKGSRKTQVKVARGKFPFYTNGGVNVVAVEDVVDGILLAAKLGKNGERYILSSENMTIKNLFERIAFFAGVKAPQTLMPDWALHTLGFTGDTLNRFGLKGGLSRENAYTASMHHWFSSAKAQKDLGFNPKPSDLAIENSVRWMKENGYLS